MRKLIFLVILVAGCATPEQIAQRQALQARQAEAQREAYRQHLFGQCDRAGFRRGTDGHANCVIQLHNQNQSNAAALGAAAVQGWRDSLPYCASVVNPFMRGQMRARGECRP